MKNLFLAVSQVKLTKYMRYSMEKIHLTQFMKRQYMLSQNFELFYFDDLLLNHVAEHSHDFFELYFFMEGNIDYIVDHKTYHLKSGDFLIIPSGTSHCPVFKVNHTQYRRFVLWIKPDFIQSHSMNHPDLMYMIDYTTQQKNHLIHVSDHTYMGIQARFVQILEEMKSTLICNELESSLQIISLLIHINRIIYEQQHDMTSSTNHDLHFNICHYINHHLYGDLSLDKLSAVFYLNKYHISHVFKKHMGVSIYQYILQKRLSTGKNCILSGIPIVQVHLHCGFHSYPSFFRAFKKEYGISPKEFQKAHRIPSKEYTEFDRSNEANSPPM